MLAKRLTPILNVSRLDVAWPPTDMPWGVREMHLRHPDGHVFRIGKGIED
jgi:hypothetical protein